MSKVIARYEDLSKGEENVKLILEEEVNGAIDMSDEELSEFISKKSSSLINSSSELVRVRATTSKDGFKKWLEVRDFFFG